MFQNKDGYSLIEVLVVLAFFSLLAYLSFSNIISFGEDKILDRSAEEVIALITETRQKAAQGLSYGNVLQHAGIWCRPNGITQFVTPDNYTARISDLDFAYSWPANIVAEHIVLPDNCVQAGDCLFFAKGTGLNSAAGQIVLKDANTNYTRTIYINTNGLVYQE